MTVDVVKESLWKRSERGEGVFIERNTGGQDYGEGRCTCM